MGAKRKRSKNPLDTPHAGLSKMGTGPGANKILKNSTYGIFNGKAPFYIETKIVAADLNTCRDLCNEISNQGFKWDGTIQNDGITYWAFVSKNNGLVKE